MRVPEEINRRIVDHTADINLTYSTIARDYLLREGLPPGPGHQDRQPDVRGAAPLSRRSIDGFRRAGRASALQRGEYFLVSAHREENIDSDAQLQQACRGAQHAGRGLRPAGHRLDPSAHPQARRRAGHSFHPRVQLLKPLGFTRLRRTAAVGAQAVLSDSGTITEESSILNFPALNLREATSAPKAWKRPPS